MDNLCFKGKVGTKNDKKKDALSVLFYEALSLNYLLQTYIVTSKPKRISVAAGVVHIIFLLSFVYQSKLLRNL